MESEISFLLYKGIIQASLLFFFPDETVPASLDAVQRDTFNIDAMHDFSLVPITSREQTLDIPAIMRKS